MLRVIYKFHSLIATYKAQKLQLEKNNREGIHNWSNLWLPGRYRWCLVQPATKSYYEPNNWSANKFENLFHLCKDPRNFSIFSFNRTIKDRIIKPPQQKWSHFKEKCKFEMIYCKSMQTKHSYKMALRQSAIVYKW